MKHLFVRTLITVLAALLVLVAVMAAVSLVGFRRSLDVWARARSTELEEAARQILIHFPDTAAAVVPEDVPLFVYNTRRELIFSNRGEGARRRAQSGSGLAGGLSELRAVEEKGTLLGYYRTGLMRFENDAANSRFLGSLRFTVWLGLALALIIAVPFALLFSRSLSRPAVILAEGLERMSQGELSIHMPERGTEEMAMIARSTNRLGEQLKREREIRRQWVQDIAHDLRTPIAAMRAQFEGMHDGVLELSRERIEKSLGEISRLEALVAGLEELMRLESPEMTVAIEEIESAAFIEQIGSLFAAELAEKSIHFTSHRRIDRFPADPALLHRAVSNFFANALRHTPRSGSIDLSIETGADGRVCLSLVNSGDSIPEADLEKVFDRLYRGEYARSSPGSGLGLSIAKRIAELHGGSVALRNRKEGGVEVTLIL
jgi:two-component system sensor histidine kinase BaeS